MQVKKEELRQNILNVAKHEFIVHGFHNASLRQIAQKANTTIGNLYHYFPSKEAILDEILVPTMNMTAVFIDQHIKNSKKINSIEEIDQALFLIDKDCIEINILLSDEFVILMKTDVERYAKFRESLKKKCQQHIAWHMNTNPDNHFVGIVTDMMIDCIIHLNRCGHCSKDKKEDFINLFRMLCKGVISTHDSEDMK